MLEIWQKIPLVKVVLPVFIGVYTAHAVERTAQWLSFLFIVLVIISVVWHWTLSRSFAYWLHALVALPFLLSFFCLGAALGKFQNKPADPRYYQGFVIVEEVMRSTTQFRARFTHADLRGEYGLFSHRKGQIDVSQGDTVFLLASLRPPAAPKYDFLFDERSYLRAKGVRYRAWLAADSCLVLRSVDMPGFGFFANIQRCGSKIVKDQFGPLRGGLLNALILGDRSTLDKGLKRAFVRTGSIHVLAVSGMHVGAVFLFFNLVFSRLLRWRGPLVVVFTVCVLWAYALITGLAPPVFRAALMLSIFQLAKFAHRGGRVINTLLLSALIILFIDPSAVYSLSFQFSYLALLGIVLFYKRIESVWLWSEHWTGAIWSLIALGLSAQILLFPFSIYHFGQFSVFFILSGVLVVPFMVLLFYLGSLFLIFSWSQADHLLAELMGYYLDYVLTIINELSSSSYTLVSGLLITPFEMLMYYITVTVLSYLARKGRSTAILLLAFFVLFLTAVNQSRKPPSVLLVHPKALLVGTSRGAVIIAENSTDVQSALRETFINDFGRGNWSLLHPAFVDRECTVRGVRCYGKGLFSIGGEFFLVSKEGANSSAEPSRRIGRTAFGQVSSLDNWVDATKVIVMDLSLPSSH